MQLWGKLACATAGLAAGGPIGALVGGFAGHYFIDRDKEEDVPAENQVPFTVAVVALGAKMAKADGIVTRNEVAAFKEVSEAMPALSQSSLVSGCETLHTFACSSRAISALSQSTRVKGLPS